MISLKLRIAKSRFCPHPAFWAALAVLSLLGGPADAGAEFAKLGPFTYGETGGYAFVVIVPESLPRPGIFVVQVKSPIRLEDFKPEALPQGASTIFVELDTRTGRYTKIVLPGPKEFPVKGRVVVETEDRLLRVSVDPTFTAYCTVRWNKGEKPAVLGLAGAQYVFSYANPTLVPLVEANSLLRDTLVKPYVIRSNRELTLNGALVPPAPIGVQLELENPCLLQGVKYVREWELPQDGDRPLALGEGKTAPSVDLSGALVMNVSSTQLTVFDYASHNIWTVSEMKDTIRGQRVCLIQELRSVEPRKSERTRGARIQQE